MEHCGIKAGCAAARNKAQRMASAEKQRPTLRRYAGAPWRFRVLEKIELAGPQAGPVMDIEFWTASYRDAGDATSTGCCIWTSERSLPDYFARLGSASPIGNVNSGMVFCLVGTSRFPGEQQAVLGSEALPTVGSAGHRIGKCKPCAFLYKKGCLNGTACPFCHLCEEGEKQRRQKDRAEKNKKPLRKQRREIRRESQEKALSDAEGPEPAGVNC
ncbi:unnamed protein product [Prorocentrum cordatum]|uniref:C3H1-type domain-containing protein n=1 Tax=Prorocentrum cordatum TaxID=2364126 RepID=A0ABN9U0C8_9DINO|nr:unnamed protein product [Polarella glacialis]